MLLMSRSDTRAKYMALKEEDHLDHSQLQPTARSNANSNSLLLCFFVTLFTVSASFNAFFFIRSTSKEIAYGDTGSPYVGLQKNLQLSVPHDNRTLDDPMWDAPEYDTYVGMVALGDDFVKSKGLPLAQRYPWDHSKGLYYFHGYHSLHCVYVLRLTILEFRDQKQLTWHMSHITHCLHVLREDITCYADDLPRYTGTLHAHAHDTTFSSGTGQMRMCRDWSRLREFALQHSACYRRPLDHYVPLIDRYKFCPDGSKPWEISEQHLQGTDIDQDDR